MTERLPEVGQSVWIKRSEFVHWRINGEVRRTAKRQKAEVKGRFEVHSIFGNPGFTITGHGFYSVEALAQHGITHWRPREKGWSRERRAAQSRMKQEWWRRRNTTAATAGLVN